MYQQIPDKLIKYQSGLGNTKLISINMQATC